MKYELVHIVKYTIKKNAMNKCFVIHAIRNGKEERYAHYTAREVAKYTDITQERLVDMLRMKDVKISMERIINL